MPNDAPKISSVDRNSPQASSIKITQEETISSPKPSKKSTKGGRPKRTTNEQKYNLQKCKLQALNYASVEVCHIKKGMKRLDISKQVEGNTAKFKIPNDVSSSKATVISCQKPGRKLLITHHGPVYPMVATEAHLINLILQLASMQQPIMPKIF